MADIQFKIAVESDQAQKDLAKIAQTEEKISTSTRKATKDIERQEKALKGLGSAGNKVSSAGSKGGQPQGPNLTPYIPGGGVAEQFKQAMGSILGVSGIAGGFLALKNAIDANTKAQLDKATTQQEAAKKAAPNMFFANQDARFQGQYQKDIRNKVGLETATPLEDIDKINNSFSAIVSSADDLNNVLRSVAIANKLNLASIEELTALEQKNIANGGSAGSSIVDFTKMLKLTGGAQQSKDILDEITGFKNQAMAFAMGTSLVKKDASSAEDNMKALQKFQDEGSNTNLRKYMGVNEKVSGTEMFDKFFKFVGERATKKGVSSEEIIDRIVKQGDLDTATGDALKAINGDFENLSKYLKDFSTNAESSTSALQEMKSTLEAVKKSNVSFRDSFIASQHEIDAEIIKSSSDITPESLAFKNQEDLGNRARKSGLYTQLVNDKGIVEDNLTNRMLVYNEENKGVPFIEGPAKWRKEASARVDKNIEDLKGKSYGDVLKASPELFKDLFGMAITKPSEMANNWLQKHETIKDMATIGLEDIPFAGAYVTHKQTGGKFFPGFYNSQDESGNLKENFTIGSLGQLGLDLATVGTGGFLGRKAGAKGGKEAVTKILEEGVDKYSKEMVEKTLRKSFDEISEKTGNKAMKFEDLKIDPIKRKALETTAKQEVGKNLGIETDWFKNQAGKKLTKEFQKTAVPYIFKGSGAGQVIKSGITGAFDPKERVRTEGTQQVYDSYNTPNGRDITIYGKESIKIQNDQKVSLDVIASINKSLLDLQTRNNALLQEIKNQNIQQKPYNRNLSK